MQFAPSPTRPDAMFLIEPFGLAINLDGAAEGTLTGEVAAWQDSRNKKHVKSKPTGSSLPPTPA
jgi:hypothetical protein